MTPRAERPRRRSFTAEDKLQVLAEYDAPEEPGARGALLRRAGLYCSHLVEWRKARDAGALGGLSRRPGGPRRCPEQAQIQRLRSRAENAERELAKTRAALEIVGKAHALVELLAESADAEPTSSTRAEQPGARGVHGPARSRCFRVPIRPARCREARSSLASMLRDLSGVVPARPRPRGA